MPTSRRTRKRSTRAEEAAEQAVEADEVAAAVSETKSSGTKAKKRETKKKRDKSPKAKPSSLAKEEEEEEASANILSSILPASISDDPSSLLCHLLFEIQSLANSKKRCTEALRALKDGRGIASPHYQDDMGEYEQKEGTTATATTATGRGKKLTRSSDKKKKKRGTTGVLTSDPDGNTVIREENGQIMVRDAHIIIATTQAINILITFLKDCKKDDKTEQTTKHTALILAALSNHLMTSLVNDKSLLESITKSSQYSASHFSHVPSSFGAVASMPSTWGRIEDDDAVMMEGDETDTTGGGRKAKGVESEAMQQKLERKRKMTVAYAKAVAGRAMTSCVVGAMNAMEALGGLSFEESRGKMEEGGFIMEDQQAEYNLLRRGVWTCLLALETAFQMNCRPKLLMTSSMPTSSLPSSKGMVYSGEMDFGGMVPTAMGSTGASSRDSSQTTWMHTHLMMGANTVSMWNSLLQRIMFDYKLGFHLQNDGSSKTINDENQLLSHLCREITQNAFSDEDSSKFISMVLQKDEDLSPSNEEPPIKKAKRASKHKKQAKNESVDEKLSELSSLLAQRDENHILFDCHVSVRRWSTLAFGWLCSGQLRFLETCTNMLTKKVEWKKILEMAPIESNAAEVSEEPKSPKKKKKDSKTKRTPPLSDTAASGFGGIKGDLALVIFTSCMVDLISSGGASPLNAKIGIDDYVKCITQENEAHLRQNSPSFAKKAVNTIEEHTVRQSTRTKSKAAAKAAEKATATSPKGVKKSISSWVRPNVTNEVAYLTKLLVQTHVLYLQGSLKDHLLESESEHLEERRLIVNDDDSYRDSSYRRQENELASSIVYYPFMHRTLEALGRTAAASSFSPSSGAQSRIQAIGGAVALSLFANHYEHQAEGKCGVVVLDAKLISLAVMQLSDSFNSFIKRNGGSSSEAVCDDRALDDFVQKYKLNQALDVSRPEKNNSNSHSYGTNATVSYGGAFSAIDGISTNSPLPKDTTLHPDIISCFIRAQLNESVSGDSHLSGIGCLFKSLLMVVSMCYDFPSERGVQSNNKSTKKKKRKASEASSSLASLHPTSSKTMTRCVLSADVLTFLRACLTETDSKCFSLEVDCMISLMRKTEVISTTFVKKFIDAGYALEDQLIHSRLRVLGDKASFTLEERRLWSSHIKLALTIGRGQAACKQELSKHSHLQESGRRLDVLQHLSILENERRQGSRSNVHYWPLFLPPLQHALVAATLSSSITTTEDSSTNPELFLCISFLRSIEDSATSSEDLTNTLYNIPISSRDARLFLLAATKLDKDQQISVLRRLVEVLNHKMPASKEVKFADANAIRLLGRGLTLAAHMADIVTTSGLEAVLSQEVASTHYPIPKILERTNSPEQESVFLGLFGDSSSPSVPATGVTPSELLSDSDFDKMTQLVKSSLECGFNTSSLDGGYLLFSSWNASAKLCSWTPACWNGPLAAATIKKQDVLERLITLRDDMCEVWHLFNENAHNQQSLLEKTTSSKKTQCRPTEALLSGITSAEQVIKRLVSEINAAKENADAPTLSTFAYYEAMPVYMSFLVSMHTQPSNTSNSSAIHRFSKSPAKRAKTVSAYTNEDVLEDEVPSSDESDFESFEAGGNSLKTRALSRLHNACVSLGAAPCWPDWLDTSCRLQTDVASSVAIDSADSALLSMTNLGIAVYKQYCHTLQCAFSIAGRLSTKEPIIPHALLRNLLASKTQYSERETFYSHLSLLSKIEVPILIFFVNDCCSLPGTRISLHSGQKIKGADVNVIKNPTIAEMRANEQWEGILGEVLKGSSPVNNAISTDKPALQEALEKIIRWKRVLYTVVSSLVPTAALLRFGLYDAKGRNPHPLCNDLPESALSSETMAASRFSTRNQLGSNVNKALSFLSHICAHFAQDDSMCRASQATANHLIESSAQADFVDMIMLQSVQIHFKIIEGLFGVLSKGLTKPVSNAAFSIVSMIFHQISSAQCTSAVLASFGLREALQTQLIGDRNKVEAVQILESEPSCYPEEPRNSVLQILLISLAGKNDNPSKLRLSIAETLCRLVDDEEQLLGKAVGDAGPFRIAIASALDDMTKEDTLLLVDLLFSASSTYRPQLAKCSVKLLVTLATTQHETLSGNGCKLILDELTENVCTWAFEPTLVTDLVCILASRFGTLPDLMNNLLALVAKENNHNVIDCIQNCFHFMASLARCANRDSTVEASSVRKEPQNSSRKIKLRTCTFTQTGEGFAEQHWYNCYTCGLLWDKGCCSLCARICHKGHDVGYSRKSSFFCDCGADDASGSMSKCKCLNPIDDKTLNELNDDGRSASAENRKQLEQGNPAKRTYLSYPAECDRTLQLIRKEAEASSWTQTILALFSKSFKTDPSILGYILNHTSVLHKDSPLSSKVSYKKPDLDMRYGVPLNLQLLKTPSMQPVRAAKANSIKIGLISSSPVIHMRRHRNGRHLMEIDMRGRIIAAESNTLSFFSAIPSVNTRHVATPHSSHLSRSQLCCLGSEKIKFDVHGMSLSDSQNLLVVWGASEACVVILSRDLKVQRIITLALQLDSDSGCESEYLLRFLWLTETILVGICGTVVHLFDLSTATNEDCKATAHFALAYEDILIRSAVLTADLTPADSKEVLKKLVLLLDNGRIHFIELYVNEDGSLGEEGETFIEIGSGTSFPSAGIRRYGGEPSSASSTSTTFGEGTNLHFLRQSNLLLYQCVSSPVVAMGLDKNGDICGTFELLPSTISSDNLDGSTLGVLTGPFLHFQELGTTQRNGQVLYRISCVARVPSSNQHKLLLVEFNGQSDVLVKELSWATEYNAGLGSYSSSGFVGSSTFSAPYLIGGSSSQGTVDSDTEVYERAYLTMLSSNGSILWFGEDCDRFSSPPAAESLEVATSNDIYMFEDPSIINISEDDRLIFAGDCTGKDNTAAKQKLSLSNSEFISSPNRDGCTLTARLSASSTKSMNASDLAIVAIRVLVGSMPELIPREISVLGSGRAIKTKRNTKRWYDFVLTDEEILLVVRNGFVTIQFSSSHDLTSGAVVDAVEVYARARSDLHFLEQAKTMATVKAHSHLKDQNDDEVNRDSILCIKSLAALAHTLENETKNESIDVIRQIMEKTALDSVEEECTNDTTLRASALSLLHQIVEDKAECSRIIGESTLKGLIAKLNDLGRFVESDFSKDASTSSLPQDMMIQSALDVLVHIVIAGSNIAKASTSNYKTALLNLLQSGTCETSLAVAAKRIIDYVARASHASYAQVAFHLSELILLEMECSTEKPFAQFDSLSDYLMSSDPLVVEACCKAIMASCTDSPKPKMSRPKLDQHTQENPAGYVTYQCDACKAFPIKDIRYTIGGEVDIDLCKDCFELGCTFATSHPPDEPLVIHGRTLCIEDEDMLCNSIWQMNAIVIAPPVAGFPKAEDVEAALKMSQSTKELASADQGAVKEEFRAKLFTNVLSLVSSSLKKSASSSSHVYNLLLSMAHGSKNDKLRISKGTEMLRRMTDLLQDLLKTNDQQTEDIIIVLRTLSSLATKKTSACPALSLLKSAPKEKDGYQHKSKTDPRFVCDVHKVPAVRRRCSHGVDKDRRFYVCGLERKHRCNYFKWADEADDKAGAEDQHIPQVLEPLRIELARLLNMSNEATSIQSELCQLVGSAYDEFKDSHLADESGSDIVTDQSKLLTWNEQDLQLDESDGIIQSWIKLGRVCNSSATKCSHVTPDSLNGAASLISESLYLFSFVASSQNPSEQWYPVLCALITGGPPILCQLAKKCLQQLCGGNQDLYHRIRDHYVYGYQFRKLLRQSEKVFDQALISAQMAKQCGANWRDCEIEFATLQPAGLLGVGELISEDCLSESYEQAVKVILDELLRTAATHARKCNWRNFCALSEIPADSTQAGISSGGTIFEQLLHRPPIISILWLSFCLRGSNQTKLLQLADIAISTNYFSGHTTQDSSVDGDGVTPSDHNLLSLSTEDLHAFIVEFLVNGRSKELRCVSNRIAFKLASQLSYSEKKNLLDRLVDGLLREIAGKLGRTSEEFIDLLNQFAQNFKLNVSDAAPRIANAVVAQMIAANDSSRSPAPADMRCDIANCVHCHSQRSKSDENETWVDEQLRPCVKSRLESSTLASCHSEYASFFQLKFRVVLSEVHLTVSDPRGRLVKNVGVYCSPRPIGDVSILKSDKYSSHWQRCGTLSLARHATTASLVLNSPVVAANIKLKYEDFYEKAGGSNRASDGSFALHCPRCTRQVNNAHGVCGNCGEVAFQCRKCRHINYDRLDAFLCVECGYCTSGAFSFDVSVGTALNAVAIMDEDEYQRSISMLRIANKRHSELRNSLKKKVLSYAQDQNKLLGQDERLEEMNLYGPHLKRAFCGRLPKMNDGSESKPSSLQPTSDVNRSTLSSRARSLATLVRQLRSDSAGLSGDSEGLSRSELLQQALFGTGGSSISNDVLEELQDTVFGTLPGSSAADLSLTRAIAGLQDRWQRSSRTREEITTTAASGASKEEKKVLPIVESNRIYAQMREAERECHELTRRIEAWNRLNLDELRTTGPRSPFKTPFTFEPSSCSICSPYIALSLTSLLSTIFEASISQSESSVTPELIKLLLTEPDGMNTELKNSKRQTLITLVKSSDYASKLILSEIKLRLGAVQDQTSAELLGQIIALDFPNVGEYIEFAVSVLQESYK